MSLGKVEICGVDPSKLPILKEEEKKEEDPAEEPDTEAPVEETEEEYVETEAEDGLRQHHELCTGISYCS